MTRAARENSTSHFRRSLHGLLGALALGALASPVCAQTLITPEHGYVGRSPGDGSTPRPKGQEVYEQFLESQRKSSEAIKTLVDRIQAPNPLAADSSDTLEAQPRPLPVAQTSASDTGCCSIQKVAGTKTWDCLSATRSECARIVKDLGLEREPSRWNFDKGKVCGDVDRCK